MNGLTNGRLHAHAPLALACLAGFALLSACATDQQQIDAIVAVNQEFRAQYEAILSVKGTRGYALRRDDAFNAMSTALTDLGMRPGSVDASLGFMSFYAQAPTPLSGEDWRNVVAADLPRLREIAREHMGFAAEFIQIDPEGLEIVINATVLDSVDSTVLISLTMRMRKTEPPSRDMPRRDYPSPTAMRMALDKVWTQFDLQVATRRLSLPQQPYQSVRGAPGIALSTPADSTPKPGDTWTYRYIDQWKPGAQYQVTHTVMSVNGTAILDRMTGARGSDDHAFAPGPMVVFRGRGRVEFSPYLLAQARLEPGRTFAFQYVDQNFPQPWSVLARVSRTEPITVPAGTFDTVRIDIEGNRPAWQAAVNDTGSATRLVQVVWFSAEVKRVVKQTYETFNAGGMYDRDVYELISYKLN
ncbi:MAG TPA: hypothetical protein VEH03_02730 [Burkholderiales bacterium]|nr:hypothetical protein [Burkholderiales bacterium]